MEIVDGIERASAPELAQATGAELSEEPDECVDFRSGFTAHYSDLLKPTVCTVDGFSPPRADPVSNTRIGPEDESSDRSIGKWSETQGGNGCAEPNLATIRAKSKTEKFV